MSATKGINDPNRDQLDRYYTPPDWCAAVVSTWAAWLAGPGAPGCILEPSIGAGDWSRALRAAGYRGRIVGVDVDPEAVGEGADDVIRADFAEVGPDLIARERPGLIVGNLPFRHLDQHARICLAGGGAVSLLTRTAWVQTQRFSEHLAERGTPSLLLAVGRMAFRRPDGSKMGTDSADYAQVQWRPRDAPAKPAAFERLVWKRPRKRKGDA